MLENQARYVCTLDVVALYPSIPKEEALVALDHALSEAGVDETQKEFVKSIVQFSINNSVVQYRGGWYTSKKGIPTGGPDSGSIANIFVKWLFMTKLLQAPEVIRHNHSVCRKRYLDDVFLAWKGTIRQFNQFVSALNAIGSPFGIKFQGSCDKKIEFLDVLIDISGGVIKTKLFVKPTDSPTYLNRRSYHNHHVFKSLPYSQFRRAVVICSDPTDRQEAVDYMYNKFVKCGYSEEELDSAKATALNLNREQILGITPTQSPVNPPPPTSTSGPPPKTLTFVMTYSCYTEHVKKLINSLKPDILMLTGTDKIIIANRKNQNTAALMYCKSSFSNNLPTVKCNQKCSAANCKSCNVLNLPKQFAYNDLKIKLDFSLNCKSDNVIYVAKCNICHLPYFGQTCNRLHIRLNGHRACFKTENFTFEKSALSMHIFTEHVSNFDDKLDNFSFGIIQQVAPRNLDRAEDFYIFNSRSDILGLNRYKVCN